MRARSAVLLGFGLLSVFALAGGCMSTRSMKRSGEAYTAMALPKAGGGVAAADVDEEGTALAIDDSRLDITTNATDRLIIYDATLYLVVQDIRSTLDKLRALATSVKGYMDEMSANAITLRVPASRLNEAIELAGRLGEITNREIKGSDVTDEMRDLDIRLKNAEETRNRLLKLLERCEKVEDLLKAEQELERITEALDLLKGRIKSLRNSVAYSTLQIHLNSPVPQTEPPDVIPFAWVRELASEIAHPAGGGYRADARFRRWLKLDLPPGYVKVSEGNDCTRAISGSGVMLLIRRERNFEGGTREFWSQIIRRSLTASRAVAIAEQRELTLDTGARGVLLAGTKTVGRSARQYLLGVVVNEDHVHTFECWGSADEVTKDKPAIEKAVRSMQIRP